MKNLILKHFFYFEFPPKILEHLKWNNWLMIPTEIQEISKHFKKFQQ